MVERRQRMAMLVSTDLLEYWQKMIPPPAQLVLCRVVGTDNQFILRVRYKEVYLDMQLEVPMSAEDFTKKVPMNEIGEKLAAMGHLVVPPEDKSPNIFGAWNPHPEPMIMPPIAANKWHYDW